MKDANVDLSVTTQKGALDFAAAKVMTTEVAAVPAVTSPEVSVDPVVMAGVPDPRNRLHARHPPPPPALGRGNQHHS